jgi:hypothetical protein
MSEAENSPFRKDSAMETTNNDFMKGNSLLAAAREQAKEEGYSNSNFGLTVHRAGPNTGLGMMAPNLPPAAEVSTERPASKNIKR